MGNETDTAAMAIEARTIRKVQIRILPFIFLLYIICFLDRINIGFAALTMNKELAITRQQFGLLTGIFFIGYFLFEIPSNLLLHKIGARIWIARILITWGAVAALTGFVHSVHQLYAVRFLLGLAEAGFAPGMLLYLTYWFRQREQAQAVALYLSGMPIASVLGAPISGFILDHVHWLGVSSWRWLLVLEGIPAVVCGLLTYLLLPSRPAEAKFLTPEEKEWIRADLVREEKQKLEQHRYSALQALTNGRVWHLVADLPQPCEHRLARSSVGRAQFPLPPPRDQRAGLLSMLRLQRRSRDPVGVDPDRYRPRGRVSRCEQRATQPAGSGARAPRRCCQARNRGWDSSRSYSAGYYYA